MLKYIELKTGYADNGPAWIAQVVVSRSGRTLYFADKALRRGGGQLGSGNYLDIQTREVYWVSGVKKSGRDRHWAGSGSVSIEAGAVTEYLAEVGAAALPRGIRVIDDLPKPDPGRFVGIENEPLQR
jgi:hypothetical protein